MGFDGKATLKQIEFINKLISNKELLNWGEIIPKKEFKYGELTKKQFAELIESILFQSAFFSIRK